jgi:2-beta-glucuronyltransferase
VRGVRRVVLFSYHYLGSNRKAGFHWIADAFWRMGWDVVFVTAPISRISRLRGDFRFDHPVLAEANRLVRVDERLRSYVLYTSYHPVALPNAWMNWLAAPLFTRYGRARLGPLAAAAAESDLMIIESTPAIMLVPQLKHLNPNGRLVYRASDDLTFPSQRTPPFVFKAEELLAPAFDLISAASHITVDRLGGDNATYHPHGVAKHLFDLAETSPYADGTHVVWVGTKWIDNAFLELAATAFPAWDFHVVGPISRTVSHPNIHYYGELPFEETIPFIRHADIGWSTFPIPHAGGRARDVMRIHSLKTMQYTYCGLPIVAPRDLVIDREHVFPYDVTEPSTVRAALEAAAAAGRKPELAEDVFSWDDLARILAGEGAHFHS